MLRSFHSAHSLIVQEEGTLTTLTACVVLPIRDASSKEGKMDRSDLLHYGAVYGRGNRIDPNYLETGEYLQGILLDILWYFPIYLTFGPLLFISSYSRADSFIWC